MRCNAERLIEALIAAQLMEMQLQHQKRTEVQPRVVTISRSFGAMGKEVAQLLADTLEVRCCDRYIMQEVARRAHMDGELVKVLDEHVSNFDKHWWQELLNRKDTFSQEDYYQHLVKVVLSISRTGGVILGRGANIILGPERAFRVRITGGLASCSERVSEREHIKPDDARKCVVDTNRERAAYILNLYNADIDDTALYDLVINSDRYNPAQMVEIILIAMRNAGQSLPEAVLDSLKSHE
jgi:cytidylate kinase